MEQPSFFQAIFGSATVYFYWVVWIFTNIACTYFVYQSAIRRTSLALNIGAYCSLVRHNGSTPSAVSSSPRPSRPTRNHSTGLVHPSTGILYTAPIMALGRVLRIS